MNEKENKKTLDDLSIADLTARLIVVSEVIREAQAKGDERWERVVAQQRRLNEALVRKIKERRRIRGGKEPEPVVVGMRPAKIVSRRPWI